MTRVQKTFLRSAVLLAGVALAAAALRHGLAGHAGSFESPYSFVIWATLAGAIGVPRQLAAAAAGAEFGVTPGIVLSLLAQIIACGIDFCWARYVARDWAQRRMSGRIGRVDAYLAARPFASTLVLRLLPISNNLAVCLLAGVSRLPAPPFILASAIGYVPQTVVFALIGAGGRLGHSGEIAVSIALFLASSALGLWLLRRRPEAAALAGKTP
jgi:uncharacterized membrane protein YdjX (TVP38/TMEM64 family)